MNVKDNVHVIDAAEEHSHTIILLHGRECTATDFASELLEGQASDDRTLPEIFPSIKWVFLNSGTRTYSRFGSKESQWFDMWDMRSPQERKDLQIDGLRESIAFILSVIRTEAAFVPPERIIIGGISQGMSHISANPSPRPSTILHCLKHNYQLTRPQAAQQQSTRSSPAASASAPSSACQPGSPSKTTSSNWRNTPHRTSPSYSRSGASSPSPPPPQQQTARAPAVFLLRHHSRKCSPTRNWRSKRRFSSRIRGMMRWCRLAMGICAVGR